jgi:hypothetical protein
MKTPAAPGSSRRRVGNKVKAPEAFVVYIATKKRAPPDLLNPNWRHK